MANKNKASKLDKKSIFMVSVCILGIILAAVPYAVPVNAGEEPIDAEVTVTSPTTESYGASVIASSGVWLSQWTLGEPDNRGALMHNGGWVSIELKGTLADCRNISVWLAKMGWGSAKFNVYASSDGNNWAYVGGGNGTSSNYARYDFSGAFGDVKYIKVERNEQWSWSLMFLDAVYAKGGGA